MKKLIPVVLSLIALSIHILRAQPQVLAPQNIPSNFQFEWLKQFHSTEQYFPAAMLNKIEKTQDGNFVLAGVFVNDVTYEGQPFSVTDESHSTVFQMSPAGEIMWKTSLRGVAPDCGVMVDMVIADNGDIYILGVGNHQYYWQPTKSFVFKLNSSGEILQSMEFPSQYLFLEDLALTSSGDLIIVGNYTASDVIVGGELLPQVPDHWFYSYKMNYVLIKVNSSWEASMFSVGNGSRYGYNDQTLAIDQNSGSIYVGGRKASTTPAEETAYGPIGLYFSKFAPNGDRLWEKQFNQFYNNGGEIAVSEMVIDQSDNLYMTGKFINVLTLPGPSNTSHSVTSSGQNEAFTAKFNADGENLWLQKVGSQYDSELGASLVLDNEENLWVGFNELSHPRVGNIIIDYTDQNLFVKYSSDGEILEVLSMPGYENEIRSITVDENNDLYFTGWMWSDLIIGTEYVTSAMPWQVNGFIGKISRKQEGLHVFAQHHSGINDSEVVVPIKVSDFEDVIGSQFPITWNPDIAELITTENHGLTGMSELSFGTSDIANGHLGFSWTSSNLQGATLADNSTLFALRFKLIGSVGQTTEITITSQPVEIEFVKENFEIILTTVSAGDLEIIPPDETIK